MSEDIWHEFATWGDVTVWLTRTDDPCKVTFEIEGESAAAMLPILAAIRAATESENGGTP